ncbi:MAG: hypothetical protein HRT72_00680 [Flavobacteriales bacterium]|nr:hypothetical protein [Flavobacteriales bacterium]
MRRISTIVLALMLVSGLSYAQDYKAFKWGLGIGYAIPGGEGAGGGFLLDMEPAYRLSDAIAVGLRVQTALMVAGSISDDGTVTSGKISAVKSYVATGQYYLMDDGFRPHVGLGFGVYRVASIAATSTGAGIGFDNKIGLPIRLGFDAGHFTWLFEYNLVAGSDLDVTAGDIDKINNSYMGIKLGGFFGGGKK